MRVDADPVARWPTEQFVDGHAEQFSFDVPERLLDAAQRAGQNRAAAIKGMTINRLPVMNNIAGIFPNQIGGDLFDSRRARARATFEDGFAKPNDAFVRVHFEEQVARLD